MEYINSELGLPVKGYFKDAVSSRYMNASGRGANKAKKAFLFRVSPVAFLVYNSLNNSQKKRYKEVMGSASNPQSSLINHYEKDIIKPKYPFNSNMSSETLQAIVEELTKEYSRYDIDRDSKAAAVAKNDKKFSVSPNRELIADLQRVRGMMQAINDYRADVVKAYDKAFAREEKAAGATPPPTPAPPPTAPPTGTAPMGIAIENPSPAPPPEGLAKEELSKDKKFPFTILFAPLLVGGIFLAIFTSKK
jgi:hypothetical protein